MKCEDVSKELIAYLDRRANSAERRDVEEHLLACDACRTRAEEFRRLWTCSRRSAGARAVVRVRCAPAAANCRRSRNRRWFTWLVPQPRLAFSMALLLALSVWIARLPRDKSASAPTEDEQFQMIEHLGVLENYDLLSKSDVLAEVPSTPASAARSAAEPAIARRWRRQPLDMRPGRLISALALALMMALAARPASAQERPRAAARQARRQALKAKAQAKNQKGNNQPNNNGESAAGTRNPNGGGTGSTPNGGSSNANGQHGPSQNNLVMMANLRRIRQTRNCSSLIRMLYVRVGRRTLKAAQMACGTCLVLGSSKLAGDVSAGAGTLHAE